MKTAKFILTFVATAAMIFAACGKDDTDTTTNNGGNNGGGNTPTNSDNMALVGNLNTPLTSDLIFDDYGTANFNSMYVNDAEEIRVHFSGGIAWESLGKTFDLTSGHAGENFWFRYEGWAENGCEFTHYNYADGTLGTWLNDSERMGEPIFSSGTLTTARTETGYTLKIEGTLTDNTPVLIKMNIPFTEEIIPLTKNSIIYDGVKYEFTTTAQQNGGTGNVTWSSTGENNVTTSGTVYQGSNNLHIYLQNNPTGDGYYFEFSVNAPDIQLNYYWENNQLTGTLNGEPFTSTPFSSGDIEIGAYYNQLKVTVIGTLNNGKELKLYVDSPY